MTAKTTLVQLHHKIQTFDHLSKHLVLVAQDCLFAYMKKNFSCNHLEAARIGDPMHFHSYSLTSGEDGGERIELADRLSTDCAGIARCLGLQGNANVGLQDILKQLEAKISTRTLMSMESPPPAASLVEQAADDES